MTIAKAKARAGELDGGEGGSPSQDRAGLPAGPGKVVTTQGPTWGWGLCGQWEIPEDATSPAPLRLVPVPPGPGWAAVPPGLGEKEE